MLVQPAVDYSSTSILTLKTIVPADSSFKNIEIWHSN
uniref:Uncharacterized protein n=1 Tax=Rhizophora mucronata TaxID=61149 RepID=A0A2P2QG32_RHIMU